MTPDAATKPNIKSGEAKGAHTLAETPLTKPVPALVVFGQGQDGKPRAAWFPTQDVTLATKAADTMELRALALCDDAQREMAAALPQGRVFASGRAFVPFVAKPAYERLLALAGPSRAQAAPEAEKAAAKPEAPAHGLDDATARAAAGIEPRYPRSWAGVVVGSLVLITEGEQDGWYEAEVTEAKGGGLYTLRWRDWPDLPLLVRRREHMALLHPNTAAVEAA